MVRHIYVILAITNVHVGPPNFSPVSEKARLSFFHAFVGRLATSSVTLYCKSPQLHNRYSKEEENAVPLSHNIPAGKLTRVISYAARPPQYTLTPLHTPPEGCFGSASDHGYLQHTHTRIARDFNQRRFKISPINHSQLSA